MNNSETYSAAYASNASTLRNWLVIYGAAVPAYFIKENNFAELIAKKGGGEWIIGCFFAGLFLQFTQVFLYKISNGYLSIGESDESFQTKIRYKLAEWYHYQTWPVVLCDLGTVIAYGYGSWLLLKAFLP